MTCLVLGTSSAGLLLAGLLWYVAREKEERKKKAMRLLYCALTRP